MTPAEAARSDIPSHDEDCNYTVLSRSAKISQCFPLCMTTFFEVGLPRIGVTGFP
jgi:hypothetical protein